MEKTDAKPGTVLLQISKQHDERGYRGSVDFDNGEVAAEALAVLMQQVAINLGVPMAMLYAKVASLLFPQELGIGEDQDDD